MKILRHFPIPCLGLLLSLATTSLLHAEEGVQDLAIGSPAPPFSLKGVDGKMHTLDDFQKGKVLVVFFTSNHCPTSHGAEERVKDFIASHTPEELSFVAINPNHPDGLSIDELGYSKYNDGYEDMILYAKDRDFQFPYLYDGDTQEVAKAYGCLATPHVFVFDQERKLRYKGRFDDSRFADPDTVKSHDTIEAVKALLAGQPVPVEITKPHGCSTKWRSKQTAVAEKMEKWDNTPVEVERIDKAGVEALRKNGTAKTRLINVWATWCAPCIQEFPDLVTASRKFASRDFEFISISLDDPEDIGRAKTFLEKHGAGLSPRLQKSVEAEGRKTNSYLYSGASQEELMNALDPDWQGGLPHTLLVAPDGEILWSHGGLVDHDTLIDTILEHLGPYYVPKS